MTVISVEEFRVHVDHYLDATAKGEVVLTRDGKPVAILKAIQENGADVSDTFAESPEFWRMIHQRRQEQGIPWEEARKQLDLGE
jgi:antitoxin (DNA-binding transcriptional repressor) of toxin-antitoxin stability system